MDKEVKRLQSLAGILNEQDNSYLDELREVDFAYRWVGQPGLFAYFYGDMPGEKMAPYVLQRGKMPELPKQNNIMEPSYQGGIPMTIDKSYFGEPLSGEAIIRLVFDMKKLLKLPSENFDTSLLHGSESEFRYMSNITNWVEYIVKIEIDRDAFTEVYESDFGDYRAIGEWYPKDKNNVIKLIEGQIGIYKII